MAKKKTKKNHVLAWLVLGGIVLLALFLFYRYNHPQIEGVFTNSTNTTPQNTGAYKFTYNSGGGGSSPVVNITPPSSCPHVTVNLLSTSNFVILTDSGITNIPTSHIIGDIGTYPITGASITGLNCPEITGTVYDTDSTFSNATCRITNSSKLLTATNDMLTIYSTANGLSPCATELGAGNIGGMTLPSGVYKWSTGVTIPTSVTLNGNSSDVWVFQIAQTLDISSATSVILTGGADAKNVYWIVTGTTSLGTTSVFNGNILDATNIALATGAKLNGRALAQTAVALDSNNVTIAN